MASLITFAFVLNFVSYFFGCVSAIYFVKWLDRVKDKVIERRFNRYVKELFNRK